MIIGAQIYKFTIYKQAKILQGMLYYPRPLNRRYNITPFKCMSILVSVATVTNYHKFGCLKQQKFIQEAKKLISVSLAKKLLQSIKTLGKIYSLPPPASGGCQQSFTCSPINLISAPHPHMAASSVFAKPPSVSLLKGYI